MRLKTANTLSYPTIKRWYFLPTPQNQAPDLDWGVFDKFHIFLQPFNRGNRQQAMAQVSKEAESLTFTPSGDTKGTPLGDTA